MIRPIAAVAVVALLLAGCSTEPKDQPAKCGIGHVEGHFTAYQLAGRYAGDRFGTISLSKPGEVIMEDEDGGTDGGVQDKHMGRMVYKDWPKDPLAPGKGRRLSGTGKWWVTRQANGYDVLTVQFHRGRTGFSFPVFVVGKEGGKLRLVQGAGKYFERCEVNTWRRR